MNHSSPLYRILYFPNSVSVIFALTAILDSCSTYVAVNLFDARELNPHTDPSSMWSLIALDIVFCGIVYVSTYLVYRLVFEKCLSKEHSTDVYEIISHVKCNIWSYVAVEYLVCILSVSMIRLIPVLNNVIVICSGFGTIEFVVVGMEVVFGFDRGLATSFLWTGVYFLLRNQMYRLFLYFVSKSHARNQANGAIA